MSSPSCGLECVLCLACARWACRRCAHSGAADSAAWPQLTSPSTFSPIPRASRAVLAAYEPDLSNPRWAPSPHGYQIDPSLVSSRADPAGRCTPYLLYSDPANREVVLAVRGLSLSRRSDYRILLDNHHLSPFDGGFVHRGLLRAAVWLLHREGDNVDRMLRESGPGWRLVVAGHSLGSGIAALLAVLIVNHLDRFGGLDRSMVRCYAFAPARCMSLNLAVKYADVIHSVVLQDDFLPRTPTPLEDIFGSIFCLPCLLFFVCISDTFMSEDRKLKDPRRLYAPGRMYHIVERKTCRCGRFPPEVRTAIPVEGRFEHIVLSCNAAFDHSLIWIEREAQKALERMRENADGDESSPPIQQKMEREQSLAKEHTDAIEKTELLSLLHAADAAQGSHEKLKPASRENQDEVTSSSESVSSGQTNWDELVDKLIDDDEYEFLLEEDSNAS